MTSYDQARACFKESLEKVVSSVPQGSAIDFNISAGLDYLVDAIENDLSSILNQQAQILRLLESLTQKG